MIAEGLTLPRPIRRALLRGHRGRRVPGGHRSVAERGRGRRFVFGCWSRARLSSPQNGGTAAHIGSAQRDRGLRDRRRRLGRVRPRQPAHRGSLGARAPARGRGQGPQPEHQDPGRVREPVPHRTRLGLLDRARAGGGRALALHPTRQVARRLELHERDALRARAPARLRPLARAGRGRVGLGGRAAVLPALGGQRPRGVGVPRRRRRDADLRAAFAATAGPPAARRERRDRDPADRRLQRARAGRGLDVPGLPEGRQALERRRRVPAPRREAPEPRGRHRGHRARAGARRRPGHRRALPARALGAGDGARRRRK